jgi:hypothetical protein
LGPAGYGTKYALSETPISEGTQILLDVINKPDPRPIWVQVWGDGATIVQALEYIRINEGEQAVATAVAKLRILDIAGQDDSGAWLKAEEHYPDLFYVRWPNQFVAMDPMSDVWLHYYPWCGECAKGDTYYTDDVWVDNNVQNHGPLGDVYPDRRYLKEGDSPSLLYVIPTGMGDPEKPWMGSWGGRFTKEPVPGVRSILDPLGPPDNREFSEYGFDPYLMYSPDVDSWNNYTNTYAPIFRWWKDFQNDFGSRMDWSIRSEYVGANHPPTVVVNNDLSTDVLYMDVFKGDIITLTSTGTIDPDMNNLTYQWWVYQEAGTVNDGYIIENENQPTVTVYIPTEVEENELHVILSVTDNGEPNLTRYRRVVFTIYEYFGDLIPPSVPKNVRL